MIFSKNNNYNKISQCQLTQNYILTQSQFSSF